MHILALLLASAITTAPAPFVPLPVSADDLHCFPPQEVVKISIQLATAHVALLEAVGAFSVFLREETTGRLREARWRREMWETLDLAQRAPFGAMWQRSRLERLRDGLGRDYYTGRMPAPVP